MPRTNQDGFDMAKLQKHIKRQQRASLTARSSVTKLSPAEIRDLNNAALASKNARMAQLSRTSPVSPIRRSPSITPPLTPEDVSIHQAILVQKPRSNLPTPPISPDNERRNLSFDYPVYLQQQTSRPQYYAQSGGSSSGLSRRSSNASSYRGVTHRSPESPPTGSPPMLQDPAQQIVTNPLSNFSRPRQSAIQSSPERPEKRIGLQRSTSHQTERSETNQDNDLSYQPFTPSQPSAQPTTQPDDNDNDERVGRQALQPTALRVRKKRSRSMPALMRSRSPSIADTPLRIVDQSSSTNEVPSNFTALPQGLEGIPLQKHAITEPEQFRLEEAKQKRLWRKNFNKTNTTTTDDRGRTTTRPEQKSLFALNRSNPSLISINYADTVAGERPLMKDSLKEVLPSNKNSVFQETLKAEAMKGDFRQHPAVRPHTAQSDARSVISLPANVFKDSTKAENDDMEEEKAEIKENLNPNPYPTYTRCSCCGKLRKPTGFTSNLSPVLENEHLRTNFSFELGRTSGDNHRHRPGSYGTGGRPKHIPIIPMEIDRQMRQAIIEPLVEPEMTKKSAVEEDHAELPIARTGETMPSVVEEDSATARNFSSRPESRSSDVRTPSRSQITMPRGKEETKVVRFANMYLRKKEMERRGRERDQKSQPGQEQMHSMSQLDNLYSRNEEDNTADVPRSSSEDYKTGTSNGGSPVSTAKSSETDLVDRMPQPPQPIQTNPVSETIPEISTPVTDTVVRDEPSISREDDYSGVDLSSMDGSSYLPGHKLTENAAAPREEVTHLPEPQPAEEISVPMKQINTSVIEEPVSEPTNMVDEYEEIAKSSPFSEEPSTPPPSFYTRPFNYSANSSDEALPLPPPSSPNGKTTTIVRLVRTPSIPLPARSPKRPQTASSNREPIKLGDWILPTPAVPEQKPTSQTYESYATMKFNGLVSTQELPTPLSASSSRDNSVTVDVRSPSSDSSLSFLHIQEVKNAQVSKIVAAGSGRVKEVGSKPARSGNSIARRIRQAHRRIGVTA